MRVGSLCVGGERTFVVEQTHIQRFGEPRSKQSSGTEEWRTAQCGGRTMERGDSRPLLCSTSSIVLTWGSSC